MITAPESDTMTYVLSYRKLCSILKGQYQNVNEAPYSMETRECIASYDKIIQEAHLSLYHSPRIIGHETFEYIFFTLDEKKTANQKTASNIIVFGLYVFLVGVQNLLSGIL